MLPVANLSPSACRRFVRPLYLFLVVIVILPVFVLQPFGRNTRDKVKPNALLMLKDVQDRNADGVTVVARRCCTTVSDVTMIGERLFADDRPHAVHLIGRNGQHLTVMNRTDSGAVVSSDAPDVEWVLLS